MPHFMQFSVAAHELCTLHCVLLNCNGTKCTGNALSIPAVAFSQQLLRETNFPQTAISLLAWSFHPMIWMCLWQIWLQTMLWLTCRDFQVDFMVNHHILVIIVHINCPHVRGPLHHILVITMHVNCHMWATGEGSPPPYRSNYCAH